MPDAPDDISIRRADRSDLEAIVNVHMQAFEGFLLTKIGRGFLRRYYGTVLDYPHGLILVAVRGKEVVGFACGFAHSDGFARRLRRQALLLLPYVLWGILRHPEVAVAALQNALSVLRERPVGYTPDPRDFEFSSLGVSPVVQGRGVGRSLVRAIVDAAKTLPVAGIFLCTDAEDNERANRLYAGAGFRLETSYVASGGRRRHYYRMAFGPEEGGRDR